MCYISGLILYICRLLENITISAYEKQTACETTALQTILFHIGFNHDDERRNFTILLALRFFSMQSRDYFRRRAVLQTKPEHFTRTRHVYLNERKSCWQKQYPVLIISRYAYQKCLHQRCNFSINELDRFLKSAVR